MAAFGVLTLVRDADGEATHLSQWSGLARKSPFVAIVMTMLLMSMAGIPLTAGFVGQVLRLPGRVPRRRPAGRHRAGVLGDRGVLLPAHRRADVLRRAPENGPTIAIPGWSTTVALTFGVVVTVVLGVFPQPVLDLAAKAATLVG